MKSILKKVAIITAVIFVSSCASSGNSKLASMETNKVNDLFVDGKTTKKDVELALGQPDDIDIYNDGDEKWIYMHVKNDSKAINFVPIANWFTAGTNDTKKKLVFIFNKDGSLQKHAFSKSRGETKAGLLGK
ncbi:MAG TPA: hypothetical protein DCZ38_01135 [Coxiellaceae bacterium]|nr:hypothetical protein [Coxiellaceae bacterium]